MFTYTVMHVSGPYLQRYMHGICMHAMQARLLHVLLSRCAHRSRRAPRVRARAGAAAHPPVDQPPLRRALAYGRRAGRSVRAVAVHEAPGTRHPLPLPAPARHPESLNSSPERGLAQIEARRGVCRYDGSREVQGYYCGVGWGNGNPLRRVCKPMQSYTSARGAWWEFARVPELPVRRTRGAG